MHDDSICLNIKQKKIFLIESLIMFVSINEKNLIHHVMRVVCAVYIKPLSTPIHPQLFIKKIYFYIERVKNNISM